MEAAKDLLRRAVELDSAQRYPEALICYEEGIQNLLRAMEGRPDLEMKELRKKAEEYLARAEEVKKRSKEGKIPARHKVQYLQIDEDATGYSYRTVFKSCFDSIVEWVEVEDPYIRTIHQIHNFVRFCELLVKQCSPKLKRISLQTGLGQSEQSQHLSELKDDLATRSITLSLSYSSTLHDREIRFSNGWMVRIGRGLDYFKKPKGQYTIGFHDYDLRPCHETTVEVYHVLHTQKMSL